MTTHSTRRRLSYAILGPVLLGGLLLLAGPLPGLGLDAGQAVAANAAAAKAPAGETAPEGEPMASVVVDVATGKVLSANRANERRYPASTTKLMTAYLALEAMRESKAALDTPVVITRRAEAEAPSKMGFAPGSVVRLDMALRMMLVKSANDMAYAIGQTIGNGSMDDFVAMMNAATVRLGMKDSHFVNPNGLPQDGQYSSAKDLAILGMTIRRDFPAFADYFGTEAISMGGKEIDNGNKLLGRFDGADGMKTGYICASGFNLVSSATRNGRTIIAVVLGANGTIPRERLSASLLEDGFKTDPAGIETTIDALPVSSGGPLDIAGYICSAKGRTDRANERVEEQGRDEKFGSPYLHDLGRAPVPFKVSLGGAAGTDKIEPGTSMIEGYGIPIPTPRPDGPESVEAPTPIDGTADGRKPASAAAVPGATQDRGESMSSDGASAARALTSAAQPSARETNQEIAKVLSLWADEAHGETPTPRPAATPTASFERRLPDADADGDGKTGRLGIYRSPAAMTLRPAKNGPAAGGAAAQ